MMEKAFLVLIALSGAFAADKNCDSAKCPSLPKHYEEMGCEAVKGKGECCASSFECPDLTSRDGSKCYYNEEVLSAGEYLKSTKLGGQCSASCYCQKGKKRSELQCAHIDCPEYFGGSGYAENCIRQYDRGHCCAIKTVCDDEVKKLSTCVFEGETYREGQRMYPNEHCYECYCSKNFSNQTNVEKNPSCNKIDCGINLRNTGRIIDGCIPVYYKKDNCCPIGWRCPGDKHQIESIKPRTAGPVCTFGKMQLSIGESLELEEKCQKCTCTTPPMLHCIETC